jgi:CDP-diacylglycerol--glycerol-3-phosphate 3-phosphatidyltransferase
MTLYDLKPRFQSLLRPLVRRLAAAGVTANQVTLAAAIGSVALGALLLLHTAQSCVVPAAAGVARRAHGAQRDRRHAGAANSGQKSRLGGYLNELCDVVSDAALLLPFAFIAPFSQPTVFAVIGLAILAEYAGVMGPLVGASRRYDGPLGKSDRAALVGASGAVAGSRSAARVLDGPGRCRWPRCC